MKKEKILKIKFIKGKKNYSALEFLALLKKNEIDLGYKTNAVKLVRKWR